MHRKAILLLWKKLKEERKKWIKKTRTSSRKGEKKTKRVEEEFVDGECCVAVIVVICDCVSYGRLYM